MALVATLVAASATGIQGSAKALSARTVAEPEYLFEVLRDWRRAKQRGAVDTKTRIALCKRAFAVADVARGRERYEALRFVAGLDLGVDSAELLAARDRALERVIAEYIEDGDIMGEFVLRVLRDDAHDRALREQVRTRTPSKSVQAACEFHGIEPIVDRALEDGEISSTERERALARLAEIAARYGDAKHPLSAKTWGELSGSFAASLRELVLVGEPAPELAGLDLTGRELRLSALRGRAVLLFFWGDWCEPCRALYPRQRELAREFAGRPLALIGINSDPARATVVAAAAKEALAWPNLWDGTEGTGGTNATRWRVRVWPTWYLIDAQGIVRQRWRGAPPAQDLEAGLEAWLPTTRR